MATWREINEKDIEWRGRRGLYHIRKIQLSGYAEYQVSVKMNGEYHYRHVTTRYDLKLAKDDVAKFDYD